MEFVCLSGELVPSSLASDHVQNHGYPGGSPFELVARGLLQRCIGPEDVREALREILSAQRGARATVTLAKLCRRLGVRGPAMARYVLDTLETIDIDG